MRVGCGIEIHHGFTKPLPSVLTVLAMGASLYFLSLAMKVILAGYGLCGLDGHRRGGGGRVLGMILFQESRELARILCIFLIVAGVLGLKVFSAVKAA